MVGRLSENFVTIAAVLMLVAGVALAACSREGSAVPEPVPAPPPPRSLSEKQCSKRYASLVECKDANYFTTKSRLL